jgi:hypothetical protein
MLRPARTSLVEKLSYAAVVVLILQARMHASDLVFGGVDLLFGVLFAIAYFKTAASAEPSRPV